MNLAKRTAAFIKLGETLQAYLQAENIEKLHLTIVEQTHKNHWFTKPFISNAILGITKMLTADELQKLSDRYRDKENLDFDKREKIAVVSAGNIPLAGFHDFFAVLFSGNDYIGKLSSHDNLLLPVFADLLIEIEPAFKERITFVEKLPSFNKIIATGSNNSSRYFDYYFGKYPHILRKNRNSMAILRGNESHEELAALFDDIFLYFGLGCRSISMLWLPIGYDFTSLINIFEQKGGDIATHHHYLNNIDYQKTIYLMNQIPFIDAGIALLAEKKALSSPIGIIYYQYYNHIDEVEEFAKEHAEEIQCVVANGMPVEQIAPLGSAQFPEITDFADGIDTILWATEMQMTLE